jgi:uncharacterized protein
VVKVGQIVKVHVLSADSKTQRIALSMKAKPELNLNQKLSALSDRWKAR